MNDDKTSHAVPVEDADATAARIAVALAAAAERIVPVAGVRSGTAINWPGGSARASDAATHTEKE